MRQSSNRAKMNATDDAYNKYLGADSGKAGTLLGNWLEERVLRETTGEGRTVPQRHVKRSGLLKDFTKVLLMSQCSTCITEQGAL